MTGEKFESTKDEVIGEQCGADWIKRSAPYLLYHLQKEGVELIAEPEERVPIFVFFACDDSKFITGTDIIAAGGIVFLQ